MKIKRLTVFLLLLCALCICAAAMHLKGIKEVETGDILVIYDGKESFVDMESLKLEAVEGIRVNGKGEEIKVSADGIGIKSLLEELEIKAADKITIVAKDSYKAEISTEEIENSIEAFLIKDEENEIRLIVFGDSNSKRSVADVAQIIVE